jgi:hypothetical protein
LNPVDLELKKKAFAQPVTLEWESSEKNEKGVTVRTRSEPNGAKANASE